MNYDEMPAGPELNAIIAEKVLGWRWYRSSSTGRRALFQVDTQPEWFTEFADGSEALCAFACHRVGAYSTDIGAAWQVVDLLSDKYWAKLTTPFEPGGKCNAGFTGHGFTGWNGRPDYRAQGDTMPEAICRAALLLKQYAPELPPLERESRERLEAVEKV